MAGAKHPEELPEPAAGICLVWRAISDLALAWPPPRISGKFAAGGKHRSQRSDWHRGQLPSFL